MYKYTICPNGNTRLEIRKGTSGIWHTFRPITNEMAFQKMTVHNASRIEKGTQIPTRKQLVIRSIVRQAPIFSPATKLGNYTWMMDTCRLRVDFLDRRLILQLPLQDWLLLPIKSVPPYPLSVLLLLKGIYYSATYLWLTTHFIYREVNETVSNLVVDLSPDHSDKILIERLRVLYIISGQLGIQATELDRIIKSVYEVWELERRPSNNMTLE
jgi:hypothetical protein